jgi:hypothetical protein
VDYSSEQERRKPKPRQKRAKKAKLEIHREQTLEEWTKRACRRMPSSRATKMWWCRIWFFARTTFASTRRSTGRRRRAKPPWPRCHLGTRGSLVQGSRP